MATLHDSTKQAIMIGSRAPQTASESDMRTSAAREAGFARGSIDMKRVDNWHSMLSIPIAVGLIAIFYASQAFGKQSD